MSFMGQHWRDKWMCINRETYQAFRTPWKKVYKRASTQPSSEPVAFFGFTDRGTLPERPRLVHVP